MHRTAYPEFRSQGLCISSGVVEAGYKLAVGTPLKRGGRLAVALLAVASATLGTMRLTGQMLSMGTAILIFTLLIRNAEVTTAVRDVLQPAIRTAFIIFAAVCFLDVFASMARSRLRPNKAEIRSCRNFILFSSCPVSRLPPSN